jgi:glycine hydroxymethyltransferase
MALSLVTGGHISYMEFGGAGVRGLKVESLPFNPEEMNVDLDATIRKIREVKPTLIFLGGSVILFPVPIKEIKEASEEAGSSLVYDASHVLGLIAGKQFQDPIGEGVDVLTSSTHKTFPGPQGGIICCKKSLAEESDKAVFPGLVSNHHLHHIAALAIALLEMEKFGVEYAKQTIKNAKALAENLYNQGFDVICADKGFTESHQVLVDVSKFGGGAKTADLLEKANIICNKNLIPKDNLKNAENPSGIRLGTAEITRLGLKEKDMENVATYIRKAIIDRVDPLKVAKEVKKFMKKFSTIKYCFQKRSQAYKYFDFY